MRDEILFDPSEYRELGADDRAFLRLAYRKALEALRRNITPNGFTACSLADNTVYGTNVNYRGVWARDGAKTVVWTLDLADQDVRGCQEATLRTILVNPAPARFPAW